LYATGQIDDGPEMLRTTRRAQRTQSDAKDIAKSDKQTNRIDQWTHEAKGRHLNLEILGIMR